MSFWGCRIGLRKEAQAGRDGARNKDERVPSGSGGIAYELEAALAQLLVLARCRRAARDPR